VLAEALKDGISPNSVWSSHKLTFNLGRERVVVENYNGAYAGITTLAHATTFSDNSVYVQVARQIGSKKVARLAREMGILDAKIAGTVTSLLQTVVKDGTGTRAAVPDTFVAGKTGTTENYGDAWFVGWTSRYTVAIWVGYPDKLRPMKTEYAGQPVAGGTFPAAIFHSFIQNAFAAYPKKEKEKKKDEATGAATPSPSTPGQQAPTTPNPAPSTQAPTGGTGGGDGGDGDTGGAQPKPPTTEQPPAQQQPTPAPTAAPPPTGAAPPAPQG
jgi:penicillin-binding protein 1A